MSGTVLIIDDEESMLKFFDLTLRREGYDILTANSTTAGLKVIRESQYDLVLSDMKLGDGDGLQILAASKEKDRDVPVIMMTAYASPETAVEAMKLGAVDYLTKPFNVDEVRVVVRNNIRNRRLIEENRQLKSELAEVRKPRLIYQSDRMEQLLSMLRRVAKMDTTILVTGESGTGKELIAKTIHEFSNRLDGPFVSVNCGALPESLLESELFGYEKGSFTGADQRRAGLFESAKGGTLFLDEIGEMPLMMQVKLLRALQERRVRRVGGSEEIPVDFRLVAATNRDLQDEVAKGQFREDLFYRINVVPIPLPALRERREDIAPLVGFFVDKFCKQCGEARKELSRDAMSALEAYEWPGNVRELENTIERLIVLTPGGVIEKHHLPPALSSAGVNPWAESVLIPEDGMDLERHLDEVRFRFMQKSLEMTGGVQSRSCELLGMSFRSFRYYLTKGKERGFF